ncbi:hypothetical protein AS034_18800 [[Bacillus] enclensis]|jgi:hypothetical protein|uniref:Uncharacterized protein n=2 Tax=Rossellomorea TaxID=2837508 RepID=A0A0V8HAM6_9BACI|nr:hypothetical protein [[Bacillus] enclensis]OAT80455.1 hypothetical protein A6P54_13770 [Bacillus sp. MKU004]QTC39968.1 hypothetical protein I7V34_12195 [Bacillus sp. V3]QWC22083.1 hypothetical protein KJK41_17680 [Bacillus haikouensis]KSU59478.1 hypothetical protein AS034_18800 [[Bacillus] enclensis]MBH9965659.1 hypothetical protein [[Bacillus] enclensis]
MTTMLESLHDLNDAKKDVESLKHEYPELNEQIVHVVSLTRQLQLKYGYMGSLLRDKELPDYEPRFVRGSILTLYQQEVRKLKDHPQVIQLKELMKKHRNISDSKLFLLILGAKPELLQGSTIIK